MVFSEDKITAPLRLDSLHVHKLIFYHSSLAQLDISEITAGTLSLHLTHIDKPSKISGILTNRLNLEGIELGTGAELDLRGLRRDNFRDARHQRIPVSLLGAQIEKLHLDWKNCSADWSTDSSDEAKTSIYEALLENFKKHGQMDSRELADKEYSRYKTYHANFLGLGFFWDFFDRMWWDYGYGGWQVIVWTLFLPFLWALAMWVWGGYRRLNDEVYELENYPPKRAGEETRVYRKTYWESLVYVSTIFFALSIKFDNLNFERKRPLLLFLIIYLNGIFCLFFIVNFLLKA